MQQQLCLGVYKHYKGNEYEVIGLAKHTETLELHVVYKQLYGDGTIWIRPYTMFIEDVMVNDVSVPRFTYISEKL